MNAPLDYDEIERQAFARQTLDDISEPASHGRQRSITLQSFAWIAMIDSSVQLFNDLLVIAQADDGAAVEACPDNMIVVHRERIVAWGSYRIERQPVRPLDRREQEAAARAERADARAERAEEEIRRLRRQLGLDG